MTWAPASASREEQNGAATACSTAMTTIPSRGNMVASSLVGAGHAEHMLGDERQHQIGRDRRHLIEPRLAEFALDVVLFRKAKTAMGLDRRIGRFPRRIRRQH